MMKRMKQMLLAAAAVLSAQLAAQDLKACSRDFWAYQELYKQDKFQEAYPKWKVVMERDCKGFKYEPNVLTDGEYLLGGLLESAASKEDSMRYAKDLIAIMQKRQETDPDQMLYWKGEEIAMKNTYGMSDKKTAYEQFKDLFKKVKEKDGQLSVDAVNGYYYIASELYGSQDIDFKEFLDVYSDDIKVIKRNAEIRDLNYNELKLKADSVKLSPEEKAEMDEFRTFADYFKSIETRMAYSMQDFMTCDNLGKFYTADLAANKDSMEWLETAVYTLSNLTEGGECPDKDSLYFPKINDAYVALYRKQNPVAATQSVDAAPVATTSGGKTNSAVSEAYAAYKAKKYRQAITKFKSVVATATGPSKGSYAYYLADSYAKTGNSRNAIIWYKKAAQYKPGWAAPYTGTARIYGNQRTINSCGKNSTQKTAAYLVAADYMKKACRYDKSVCKYVGQYERSGPSQTDMFNDGYNKGQKISITCHGGASTRLR